MRYEFLSETWFEEVAKVRAKRGEVEMPRKLVGFVLNLTVTGGPNGDKDVHFTEGSFGRGHRSDAATRLTMPFGLCIKALLENDTKAAMKGFLTRKIGIEGDLAQMLVLASIQSTGELDALRRETLGLTALD